MATGTHTLLERITVGAAGAASITFSSIPQTGYTDLKIVASARSVYSSVDGFSFKFNGLTTNFSGRGIQAYSVTNTQSFVSGTGRYFAYLNGTNTTANTFTNAEMILPNYTSANYKSYSTDSVVEDNSATSNYLLFMAELWSSSAAVTSIDISTDSTSNFAQYSTFSLYGIAASGVTPTLAPKAVGGDIIQTDGTYWYHAFINTGAFVPAVGLTADVLVVAGGGGGGGYSGLGQGGGGGGAGQVLNLTSQSLSTTSYNVTVGAGGARTTSGLGTSGTASQLGSLTAAAVGTGGTINAYPTVPSGGVSGSGNSSPVSSNSSGSGGGGESAVGKQGPTNADSSSQGTYSGGGGGAGTSTYSSWGSVTGTGQNVSGTYYYGGGGGGAAFYVYSTGLGANGGNGGGGRGADYNGANSGSGTANTGGGGGGINYNVSALVNGGSGVVIVRYAV